MDGQRVAAAVQAMETGIVCDVVLVETDDGWTVSCPACPGCHSQGDGEADALANIREGITGWLKFEARDVESRTQRWLDEYREAGFPAKTAKVSVERFGV